MKNMNNYTAYNSRYEATAEESAFAQIALRATSAIRGTLCAIPEN